MIVFMGFGLRRKVFIAVSFVIANSIMGSLQSAVAVPCADEIVKLLNSESYGFDRDVLKKLDSVAIAAMDVRALNKELAGGDRYAHYIPATTLKRVINLGRSAVAGTGMDIITDRNGRIRLIPFTGSPADISGIEYGDILKEVDGTDITGMSIDEVGYLIRGEEGTDVEITAVDGSGEKYTVPVTRKIQSYPDVVRTGSNPAVIRIFRFGSNTSVQLYSEIEKLKNEPGFVTGEGKDKRYRRFFIDLRGNTGGVMEQGALSAGIFLTAGATVYRFKNNDGIKEIRSEKSGIAGNLRFVVIQDSFTASAAEMMIAALKSGANVGTYGENSAGKSRVQDLFRLSDGSILKLTVGELLFPDSDTTWEGEGISPDVKKSH